MRYVGWRGTWWIALHKRVGVGGVDTKLRTWGCGVGGGGGGGYLHEVTEEKVIDGIVHPFACRAWACAPARHGGRGVKNGDERKRVEGEGG